MLCVRIFTGQAVFFLFYYAISIAPMTVIYVIAKIDVFVVLILGYFINGEKMVPVQVLGMVIVLITVFIMNSTAKSKDGSIIEEEFTNVHILLALVIAVLSGAASVTTRALKDVPQSIIMFYHGLAGSIMTAVWIGSNAVDEKKSFGWETYSTDMWTLMLLASLLNSFETLFHLVAFQSDTSGFIVLIGNISIVYFFLSDTLIFRETFTAIEIGGIIVIFLTVLGVAL